MKILLTVCNEGWIHKLVMRAVIRLLQDERHQVIYQDPCHRPYENALNHCVKEVLQNDYDFWLNMDADNPPLNNPIDLLGDREIIGLPAPVWFNDVPGDCPYYFTALQEQVDGWVPTKIAGGWQQVDAIGSGCMLIARTVLEKLEKPIFAREVDRWGCVVKGHDYMFSRHARQAGFRIWVHSDYFCRHYKELDLLEVIEAFRAELGNKCLTTQH